VLVGAYYGSDQRALEAEVVSDMTEKLGAASEGYSLPADAPAREIFAAHRNTYAFALVDRTGMVLDAMNRALIPPRRSIFMPMTG
jgi:two-component system, OmpR family, sensor kinase